MYIYIYTYMEEMSLGSGTGVCEKKVALSASGHAGPPHAPEFQSWTFGLSGVDPPAKKKSYSVGGLSLHTRQH